VTVSESKGVSGGVVAAIIVPILVVIGLAVAGYFVYKKYKGKCSGCWERSESGDKGASKEEKKA